MVGALIRARAIDDPELSNEVLDQLDNCANWSMPPWRSLEAEPLAPTLDETESVWPTGQ